MLMNTSSLIARLSLRAAAGLVVLAGLSIGAHAQATPVVVPAQEVPDLTSNADRMISYRHQEHMWQTSDGALHVVINRGTLAPNAGLQLYSSFDNGVSWTLAISTGNTGSMSTSDGALVGDNLSLVYNNVNNVIIHAGLQYNVGTKTWTPTGSQAVFASPNAIALNPAIAFDTVGNAWVAYVAQNTSTGNYMIRMAKRSAGGNVWTDTGLTFGAVDNTSIERSARPVALPNAMGMVFSVHDKVYWSKRDNSLPDNSAWTTQLLYTRSSGSGSDPYSSHFNLTTDDAGNIHMAMVDAGNIKYFRYPVRTGVWNTVRTLTTDGQAAYCQASFVGGSKIQITSNVGGKFSKTLVSTDKGQTFAGGYVLMHPAPVDGTQYPYARLETPARVASPAPVLQQYIVDSVQRVMLFQEP
ncbi:hypothetical protein [Aquabacterium sp.]|uniref:hypothetical protein n=1 Tax=Aquabacterium sp. TaxID=1872578 RepID=UPI00378529DB